MADAKNYGTITLLSDGRIGQKWVSTLSGSPTGGPYNIADIAVGDDGYMWVSTVAGTPGTWQQVGTGTLNGNINLTGSMTVGTGLTVTTGGASITGNSTVTGTLNVTSTLTAASLTLTSALTVPNGGTGQITLTNNGVLVGAGTAAITQLSVGATNSVLQGTTGSDPAFTTTPTVGSLTLATGNLTFSTTGQLITGDFSNATLASRLAFQTSTTNGATNLGALPNGAGTASSLGLFGLSDLTNTSFLSFNMNDTAGTANINSGSIGTGTVRSLSLRINNTSYLTIPTTGGVQINSGNLGVNTAPVTTRGVFIVGTTTGGTTQVGLEAGVTADSGATTAVDGVRAQVKTAAAAFTVGTAAAFHAFNPSLGSGSAVTTAIGLQIEVINVATNNYGIFINAPSGGTTNEGIHNAGTTNLIGATTLSSASMTGNLTFSGATRSIWTSDANELDLGANGAAIVKLTSGGGAQIGSPTGTDKGSGTINAASGIYDNGNRLAMVLIADTTLGGSATNITFSSIPGTYKHLRLIIQSRGDGGGVIEGVNLQFNGDGVANYDSERTNVLNAATSSAGAVGQTSLRIGIEPEAGDTRASIFSAMTVDIPNYAGTTAEKSLVSLSAMADSTVGNNSVELDGGSWRSTAAITSIKLFPSSSTNFVTGTRATLYGWS